MASVSRASPSIPVTEALHEQIVRAQALKMPFILYQERDTEYSSPLAPATLKNYLIPCFVRKKKPNSQSLTLACVTYREGVSFRRHAIAIPKGTSIEDMRVIQLATNVLSHSEYLTSGLEMHSSCDWCKITTQHILLLGHRFADIIKVSENVFEKKRLKGLSVMITECIARRGLFLKPEDLQALDIKSSTPIHHVETPYIPEIFATRVSSARPMSVLVSNPEPLLFRDTITRVDSMDVPMTPTIDFSELKEPPICRPKSKGRSSTGAMRTSSRAAAGRHSALPFARSSLSSIAGISHPLPRRLVFQRVSSNEADS